MIAIFRKMHKAVKLLVDKCDVNGTDFRKNTPFIAAAANGDIESMRILLESGNCNALIKNIDGHSAIHRACYFG